MPRKSPSESYLVMLTWKCNLRCPGCVYEKQLRQMHMPVKTIKKLASTITNVHEVMLAGGEPTLHPKFWDVVELIARHRPAELALLTNGYTFTASERQAAKFFGRLDGISRKTGTPFNIVVSVDDQHLRQSRTLPKDKLVSDLKKRVERLLENQPKSGRVELSFCAALGRGDSEKKVLERYGLPKRRTFVSVWHPGSPGGTVPRVVVSPEGRVFRHEQAMLQQKPIGNLNRETLARILKRHRHF